MDSSECGDEKEVFFMFTAEKRNWNNSSESLLKRTVTEPTEADSSVKISQVDLLLLQSRSLKSGEAFASGWPTPPIAGAKPELQLSEEAVLYVKAKSSISGELAVLRVTLSGQPSRIFAGEMPRRGHSSDAPVEITIFNIIEGSETSPKDRVPWKYMRRNKVYDQEVNKNFSCLGNVNFHSSKVLSRRRVILTCPNCTFVVKTNIRHVMTFRTKRAACIMIPMGLCVLPYMLFLFKDVVHICPFCSFYLGSCPAFKYKKKVELMTDFLTPISVTTLRRFRKNVRERYKNTVEAWQNHRRITTTL